ncbi:5'-3' exonuclease [Camellia lanceoleosa]|uniref:5'-3' exonuclease n=1 Tax=Camellia lanceoleosa TaxID=1840588 RepID=A0ACC0HUA5_9ERIC|nr:5'-3' exonuclease [Camellia lanceoleosa]
MVDMFEAAVLASQVRINPHPLTSTTTVTAPSLSLLTSNLRTTNTTKPWKFRAAVAVFSSPSSGSLNQTVGGQPSNENSVSNGEPNESQWKKKKRRVFFLDVNPLCYNGSTPSLHSFAHWISLFFSRVSLTDPVIAVIDGERGNEYRRQLLPSYKAHRKKFSRQNSVSQRFSKGPVWRSHRVVIDVLKKLNVPVVKIEDHEADDVVATLVDEVLQRGYRVVVASPDKDFKQLISEDVQIVMPMLELDRWSFYTLKHYIAQYNCDPSSDLSLSLTVLDGTHLRSIDLSLPETNSSVTGSQLLELTESRVSVSLFGLSLPQNLKSSALNRLNIIDDVSFRPTELERDQALSMFKDYLTAIADELKEEPLVVAILDGKTLRLFLEDEDDFAMLAENLFTNLDINDKGKINKNEIRNALGHMGVDLGIPPFSEFPLLNDILQRHGADGEEELGQAQFAQLLQAVLQELTDALTEKHVVVIQNIKIINGSKLRKLLASEEKLNAVIEKMLQQEKNSERDAKKSTGIIRSFLEENEKELGLPSSEAGDSVVLLYDAVFTDVGNTKSAAGSKKDDFQLLITQQIASANYSFEQDPRCIMGDEVDGVPGIQHVVPGFGRKTALKLLKKHGSLENLLNAAAVRTVGRQYAQDALTKYADYLRRNYEVLSLKRDVNVRLQEEWLSDRETCNDLVTLSNFLKLLGEPRS